MGIINSIKKIFAGNDEIPASAQKNITIDTYSPVNELITKREMKDLGILCVNGPARAGKDAEIFDFIKMMCEKHGRLRILDLSQIVT